MKSIKKGIKKLQAVKKLAKAQVRYFDIGENRMKFWSISDDLMSPNY